MCLSLLRKEDKGDGMMERLTSCDMYFNDVDKRLFYKKLKEYEDLEEQGLLLRLKVKPGDSLYKPNPITLKEIVEIRIESISITESGINISGRTTKMKYSFCCSPSNIGKTVFLTREEAEAALAKKGGA